MSLASDMNQAKEEQWQAQHLNFDVGRYERELTAIVEAVRLAGDLDYGSLLRIIKRYPRDGQAVFSKDQLLRGYRALCQAGRFPYEREIVRRLQMKPVRTGSGVAPVAVLTKPHLCPAACIFCPSEPGMPRSYLHDEPGGLRGVQGAFDPYRQVAGRLASFESIGHSTDKVELLILGGTWSSYPHDYQEWFGQRCLDAMNGQDSVTLEEAQERNEGAAHRQVGLVIETRPDWVTADELRRLRRLGVTKVQMGAQSLDDRILRLNRRGHDVAATRQAVRLLRLSGFKIHLHWMPNLLGATPESDLADFQRLWDDPAMRPDELKIYPTALLKNTALYKEWLGGAYQPYEPSTLIDLIIACKQMAPPYCRLSRIVRDIPARHIVAGNRISSLRQDVQRTMARRGLPCACIRCREIRRQPTALQALDLHRLTYETDATREVFLSYDTQEGKLAGFLRLSLPLERQAPAALFAELAGCAMIREVHVYGPSLELERDSAGEAQHLGLGQRLVAEAVEIARSQGYESLAVIAAIGTRAYYRRLGFEGRGLYMVRPTAS